MSTKRSLSSPKRLLVVDDEAMICKVLCEFLELEGYQVNYKTNGEAAIEELGLSTYDAMITDLKMPGMSGLELLEETKKRYPAVVSVVMTGFGTVETAIQSMKHGAYDYILKPFKMDEVIQTIERGLEQHRLQSENSQLKEALSIYKVAEAMSSSLDIDNILDVILTAVIDESHADVVSIHLKDVKTGKYIERINKFTKSEMNGISPSPNHEMVTSVFDAGQPLLVHGATAEQYFTENSIHQNFQSFIALPLGVGGRTIGHLNAFSFTPGKIFKTQCKNILAVLASRAASALENAQLYDNLQQKNVNLAETKDLLQDNYQKTIIGFAQALEESDHYTRGHSERVSIYAGLIAEGLGLSEEEVTTVVRAGLMHDIGKLGIRYDMLNKPGPLNDKEKILFREHPEKGKRILEPIPCMKNLVDAAWCHHEFYNGGGYPRGLTGEEIPLIGRIVQVADAYDAMTSDRAYRKALPHDVAVQELIRCSGKQFDPNIIEVFLKVLPLYREADMSHGGELTMALIEQKVGRHDETFRK